MSELFLLATIYSTTSILQAELLLIITSISNFPLRFRDLFSAPESPRIRTTISCNFGNETRIENRFRFRHSENSSTSFNLFLLDFNRITEARDFQFKKRAQRNEVRKGQNEIRMLCFRNLIKKLIAFPVASVAYCLNKLLII